MRWDKSPEPDGEVGVGWLGEKRGAQGVDLPKPKVSLMSLEYLCGTSFTLGILTTIGCTFTIAYSPILALVELEIRVLGHQQLLGW